MTLVPKKLIIVILVLKLLTSLALIMVRPMWFSHEPDYYNVIRFIATERTLPTHENYEDADIRQATHPPLYPLLTLPVMLLDDGSPVPPGNNPRVICEGGAGVAYRYALTQDYNWPYQGAAVAGVVLRIISLLLATGAVYLTYRTGLILFEPAVALIAAALLAFIPTFFYWNIVINNESLLLFVIALHLFFAAQIITSPTLNWRSVGGLVVATVLALLTKLNGYGVLLLTIVVLGWLMGRTVFNVNQRRYLKPLAGVLGLVIAGVILFGVFNYAQYGSVIGRYEGIFAIYIRNLSGIFNWEQLVSIFRDTRSDFGIPIEREKVKLAYRLGTLLSWIGYAVAWGLAIARRNIRQLRALVLLAIPMLIALAFVALRNAGLPAPHVFAPVRYYITAWPAFALLMSVGFMTLSPRLPRLPAWNWFGLGWVGICFVLSLWMVGSTYQENLLQGIRLDPAQLPDLAAPQRALPDDLPQVAGYELVADRETGLDLALYFAGDAFTTNYRGNITLTDSAGLQTTCDFLPAQGFYPTTRWQPAEVILEEVYVPNCGADLTAPITVQLAWDAVDPSGAIAVPQAGQATLTTLTDDLPRSTSGCLPNMGVIGSVAQVIQYNAPLTARQGASYFPSLNWYVRADDVPFLGRTYTLTHEATDTVYNCVSRPRLNDWPFALWEKGQIIYFDQCAFTFPEDAPLGTYTVMVSIDDEAGRRVPAEPVAAAVVDDQIVVAHIELLPR